MKLIVGVVATGLLCTLSPVEATVITVTQVGTVESGTDTSHLFGPGGNLKGAAYQEVYTFDLASMILTTSQAGEPNEHNQYYQYIGSPTATAVFTIGSASVTALGGANDAVLRTVSNAMSTPDGTSFYFQVGNGTPAFTYFGYGTSEILFTSADAAQPFSYTFLPTDGRAGYYIEGDDALTLDVSEITSESSDASVPEPATWALSLIGFGAIGWSMRQRKTTVSFG